MSPEDERLDIGDASAEHPVAIPSELPILPLRDTVLFPNSFLPLAVARESSVRLIEEAIAGSKLVGVFTQRDASVEEPAQDDLHRIGTATHIHKMFKLPDGSLRLIVQGLSRLQLESVTAVRPYLRARVTAGRRYGARGRSARDRRAAAEHQNQLSARRLAVAAAVRRSAGARDEHHRAGTARRLHRVEPGHAQHRPSSRRCSRRSTCARASTC